MSQQFKLNLCPILDYFTTFVIVLLLLGFFCEFPLHLPVIKEEAILEENVEDEIGKAFNSHEE